MKEVPLVRLDDGLGHLDGARDRSRRAPLDELPETIRAVLDGLNRKPLHFERSKKTRRPYVHSIGVVRVARESPWAFHGRVPFELRLRPDSVREPLLFVVDDPDR